MNIFDDIPRKIYGGADRLISQFDYLNSSSRIEAERVRCVMQQIFDRYPAEYKNSLLGRLRSCNDIMHLSAFFELVLYEILIVQGHTVLEIEPDLEHTQRSPDFLVQAPNGQRYYLEATLATGRSDMDAGAERRLNDVIQSIDNIISPDFFFGLHISGYPSAPVRVSQLSRDIRLWLDDLVPRFI